MSVVSLGPYQDFDLFIYGVDFMGPKGIFSLAQVCRQYNEWSNIDSFWKVVSAREGIPQVASFDGAARENPKEDFRILYPITLSGRIIGELFGKVVGRVPPIHQYWFDMLGRPDPYEPEKLCRDNFVFVVNPSHIERRADKETPLAIHEEGHLVEVAADSVVEQELTIPVSLKNLRVLSKYPLKGKEHLPVFHKDSWDVVFDQITSFPRAVGIHIMRRSIVEQSRRLPFDGQKGQKSLVEEPNVGFAVTPLRIRALADSIFILTSGTCPDGRGERVWTYARSPDTVTFNSVEYRTVVGGFAPGVGADVDSSDFDTGRIGVVPGGPAEVPGPLALGHLAIDDGH